VMGGRGSQNRSTRGSDLRYNLRVTLEEAYSGLQKNDKCSFNGSMHIMQWIRSRERYRAYDLSYLLRYGKSASLSRVFYC
jgi:hypothetical protein